MTPKMGPFEPPFEALLARRAPEGGRFELPLKELAPRTSRDPSKRGSQMRGLEGPSRGSSVGESPCHAWGNPSKRGSQEGPK